MSDAYDAWAPSYPPYAHNALMEVEEAAVTAMLPDVAGLTVLDAGSGTGRYTRILSQRGAKRVVALDASMAMLQGAVTTATRIRADLRALPMKDASFELIVAGLVVIDIPDLVPAIRECSRVLRGRGLVIYSTLHPRGQSLGWRRTFDTPGGTRELPAFWHSLADHQAACAAAGLVLDAFSEPALDVRPPRPPHEGWIRGLGPVRSPQGSRSHEHLPVALVLRAYRPK